MARLRSLVLVALVAFLPACISFPRPKPPGPPTEPEPEYDAACQALLDAGATFSTECSTGNTRYVHNPTQDPKHCEPTPTCAEEPTPPQPPQPPEPPPSTGAACYLTTEEEAGGVTAIENPKPDQAYRDRLREAVLVALERLTECQRGSTCLINEWTQRSFQAAVIDELVASGTCAGPKGAPGVDQVSVSELEGGTCSTVRQNYDVFLGDDHDIPVPDGTRRTVVWAKEQDAWRPKNPAKNSDCTPPPDQPQPPEPPQPPPDTGEPPPVAEGCPLEAYPTFAGWGVTTPKPHGYYHGLAQFDSVALWGNPTYCKAHGFPDRSKCPIYPEGTDERSICEQAAMLAQYGGRFPIWTCDRGTAENIPGPDGKPNGYRAYCTDPAAHVITIALPDGTQPKSREF